MIRVSRRAASRLPGPLLVVLACLCAPVEQVSAQDEGADPVGMAVDEAIRVRSDGRMTLRPFLVSGSIQLWIDGRSLDQGEFVVDEVAGHVLLKPGAFSAGDIVRVHYRVFALDLPTVFRLSREAREIPAAVAPVPHAQTT